MNVLIIAPEYPPRNIGGGGVVYKGLAEELKKEGHSVRVIAGNFHNRQIAGQIECISEGRVPIYFLPLLPPPKSKSFDASTYTLPALSGLGFLIKELLRSRQEVIHIHGLCHPSVDLAALLCIIMNKRYVLTCHGLPKSPLASGMVWKTLFRVYLSMLERIVVRKAATFTAVSSSLLNECLQEGLINEKMTVIHNGYHQYAQEYTPTLARMMEKKYSLKGKRVIFSIGRLTRMKGFDYLIDAMAQVSRDFPEAIAIIAGVGPHQNVLGQLIEERGLSDRVKLVGWISEQERTALYQRSEVVVVPSLEEPFGMVFLEALVMRKPVVAFKSASAPEIIDDGIDGLLVPVGDIKKLAQSIILVLSDEALRERMAKNSGLKIASFEWKKIADRYVAVYKQAQNATGNQGKGRPDDPARIINVFTAEKTGKTISGGDT